MTEQDRIEMEQAAWSYYGDDLSGPHVSEVTVNAFEAGVRWAFERRDAARLNPSEHDHDPDDCDDDGNPIEYGNCKGCMQAEIDSLERREVNAKQIMINLEKSIEKKDAEIARLRGALEAALKFPWGGDYESCTEGLSARRLAAEALEGSEE